MSKPNEGEALQPFREFFSKMNNDLAGWLKREKQNNTLLEDYKNTLRFIQQDYQSQKITINLGENCLVKAKRINEKIIIRCKQDIYVEFSKSEAIPFLKSLISLHSDKVKVCKEQICKIMGSMRDMQKLILQYQTLM